MIYLTLPELLHVAGRVLGSEVAVRDYGLLEAALARPQATVFGKDAYPSPRRHRAPPLALALLTRIREPATAVTKPHQAISSHCDLGKTARQVTVPTFRADIELVSVRSCLRMPGCSAQPVISLREGLLPARVGRVRWVRWVAGSLQPRSRGFCWAGP